MSTAYELTLDYCHQRTVGGRKIPGWQAIRVAIGKGSPKDINRAIRDFRARERQERGELIKEIDELRQQVARCDGIERELERVTTKYEVLVASIAEREEAINKAIERLEGMENHKLMQIHNAREEAAVNVNKLKRRIEQLERKNRELEMDLTVERNKVVKLSKGEL